MAIWEYKVITSGKGGFATPALLEKFLNDLGREEWEIIEFRAAPDNPLAFTGLARRTTQRDWTLEDAAAAAAKAEAEKLRAEFAAKFQAASAVTPAGEPEAPSFLEEKLVGGDGFRKPVDTSRDGEPDAPEDDPVEKDEWERLEQEDELPTFFEALKPHMRRNQRGPGTSVGVDYLAKKWGLDEGDVKGALVECGLQIPADENAKPVYVEYDGDLYWVNINRRGEIWINTREKPRPVFRVVQAPRFTPEAAPAVAPAPVAAPAPVPVAEEAPSETVRVEVAPALPEAVAPAPSPRHEVPAPAPVSGGTLPQGPVLLDRIRPLMRRNRRGGGGSGSTSFLARALKASEADLVAALGVLGLAVPATAAEPSASVEIGREVWWFNRDSRGGVWINGREKREGESLAKSAETPAAAPAAEAPAVEAAPAESAPVETPVAVVPVEAAPAEAPAAVPAPAAAAEGAAGSPFAAVRLLLKQTRTGGFAGKVERVAGDLGKPAEELVATLVAAGLKVPEKSREKPVFVEHAGEIFWFNLNGRGELWVNAKASKFAEAGAEEGGAEPGAEGGRKPSRRGGRGRKRPGGSEGVPEAPAAPAE